jgi:DNA-binding response OmpR family regulator
MSRILVIDDEADYCQIMKTFFQEKDHKVDLAYTLHQGLSLLEENKPDILFLDNNLPDGQGWESVDNIVEKFPQMRIYLVSAYKQRSDFMGTQPNVIVWEKPISLSDLESVDQGLQKDSI